MPFPTKPKTDSVTGFRYMDKQFRIWPEPGFGGAVTPCLFGPDGFATAGPLGNDPNWIVRYGISGLLGCNVGAAQQSVTNAASALVIDNTGAGGATWNTQCVPVKIAYCCQGVSPQFAEIRVIAGSTAGRSGPAVLTIGEPSSFIEGYMLSRNGVAGQIMLRRINPPTDTILVNPIITGVVSTDLLRLVATKNTPSAGHVTLQAYLNNVLKGTYDDSTPGSTSFSNGYPQFYVEGMAAPDTETWDDFRAGEGTGA